MSKIYDMIVIGGGPAGYTAALYAVRAGLRCAVIEKMSVGGQLTLTDIVDNYPGFGDGIDGITLGMQMQSGAERFGAESIFDEVTELSLDGPVKRVKTAFGEYEAREDSDEQSQVGVGNVSVCIKISRCSHVTRHAAV